MKALLLSLLLLPAALAAEPAPAPEVRLAVADFRGDSRADQQVGGRDAGRSLARILRDDLSVLTPLTVVGRWDAGADANDVVNAVTPAQARATGEALGATTLVGGQVLAGPDGPLIAAKVVSTGTGRTQGTVVRGARGDTVADLVSRLAAQIATIALVQQGRAHGAWPAAAIVGTRHAGTLLGHDQVGCVLDVDGRAIPDETSQWDRSQSLPPGLHEVFVRYYDGRGLAGHAFVFNALPGGRYQVCFEPAPDQSAVVWIAADTGQPVTAKAAADTRPTPPETLTLMNVGPYGILAPQPVYPAHTPPARTH